VARPSSYTEDAGIDICARLASGEPLTKICRDEDKPDISTVYRWLAANEAFRDMYAHAREDQADTLADEIQSIADEPMLGKKTTTKANGDVETVEGDMIEHRRLRVDARKWVAAKLRPKKYGEHIRTELSGPDGGPQHHTFGWTKST
jgi:hypothetical protein